MKPAWLISKLGLGDRHSQNILLDTNSGEIVHIDLGVAFDQGKALPIPELVPFRLTRDIVDAMGITGVEGVFRRCCEETLKVFPPFANFNLKVLRTQQSRLLTVVEVFIHDPLYRWTLSPLKALRLQRRDEDGSVIVLDKDSNEKSVLDAERTLLRLKQKLQGYESGQVLSVRIYLSQPLTPRYQDKSNNSSTQQRTQQSCAKCLRGMIALTFH